MKRLMTTLALALCSCAGLSNHIVVEAERCHELESEYRLWGAIALASTALAGSSALTTPIPDDRAAQFGLAITAGALIALGAAADFVRDDVSSSWGAECELVETSTASDG